MLLLCLAACVTASGQAPVELTNAIRRVQLEGTYDVLWVAGAERPARFEATHPELDLHAAFGARATEIEPASGAWHWNVRLVATSRGGERVEIDPGELHVERETVRNSRAALDESFVHRRAGLEHAFAIAERPSAGHEGSLALHLELDTNLVAHVDGDARGVEFQDECGRAVLSYRGLRAFDATGDELATSLRADGTELVIDVDDSSARYPIEIDPLISTSETKLIPQAASQNSRAGGRIAIDGDVAAVAYDYIPPTGWGTRRVAIFERIGGAWTETATVIAENSVIDLDGDWLLCARWDSDWCGDVATFHHVGNAWIPVPGVSSPDCNFTNCFPAAYGFAADLDGERIVVSDPEHICAAPNHLPAAVYVFEYSAALNMWRGKQEIFRPISVIDFGDGVALDGDDLLISSAKHVFHYHRDAALGQFVLQATVFANLQTSGATNNYGEHHPVALRDHVAILGDPSKATLGTNAGAAHIFELLGGVWRKATTLYTDSVPPAGASFGSAIAFDGSVAALGDPASDLAASNAGAVQLYTRNGGWVRAATVTASDAAVDDLFGSVALNRDAPVGTARLYVGANADDDQGHDCGSTYVIELVHTDALVYCTAKVNSAGCVPRMGFSGTPSLSSSLPFSIDATDVVNQRNGVFFYGTSGRAAIPFQDGFRCAQAPTRRTPMLFSGGNASGNDCSGSLTLDFNAWIQSGADPTLGVGSVVDGQFWYRDGAATFGTGLSEAIEFVVQP